MGFFSDILSSDDAKQTQTTTSGPNQKIQDAASGVLDRVISNGNKPYTAYDPNERVPGLVDRYGDAFGLIDSSIGGYKDDVAAAKGTTRGYATGEKGIYDDIDKFMDPNLAALTKSTEDTMNRQYDIAGRRGVQQLRSAGGSASGDSGRFGLAEAQMTKDRAEAISSAITKLTSEARDKAAGMSATSAQAQIGASRDLMALLTGEANLNSADINKLLQAAGIEQGREDALAGAKYEEFLRQQGFDDKQITTMLTQLGLTSSLMSKTSTTESTYDPGGNDLMRWLGVGISALGALNPTGGSKTAASLGAGTPYIPSASSSVSPYANQQFY